MKLDELIAALKKATDPSRELDLQILNAISAVDGKTAPWEWLDRRKEMITRARYGVGATGNPVCSLDAYTSSIDAAMTLIPEGWCPHTAHFGRGWYTNWSLCRETNCEAEVDGEHPNPAIALCIAALRARTGDDNG